MIGFYKTGYLWLLLLLPLLALLLWFLDRRARRRRAAFADEALWKVLMPGYRMALPAWRMFFILAVPALGIIALAEPRLGESSEKGHKASLDIVVAVDVSNSMLAADMYPNRLEALKTGLYALLQQMHGDRIGLVAFAGNAYPQMALTSDYGTARMFIEGLNPAMVPMQGTNLARAIQASVTMFGEGEADNRTIFLLSDGENHEDSALVEARHARDAGILLNVAAFGTQNGAPVPELDSRGQQTGFKTDRSGQTVISRANSAALRELAEAGGGYFVQAEDAVSALLNLYEKTDDMPRLPVENTEIRNKANRYLWFLWPVLFLLLGERALRNRWLARAHKTLPLLLLLFLPLSQALAQHPNAVLRQGVQAYKEGKFDLAIQKFREAGRTEELKTIAGYNLGAAYYKKGMTDSAIDVVQRVAVNDRDPDLQQKAWYNLGNAFLQQQKNDKAIEAYKKALRIDPGDENARYNLAYALRKQEEQQQQKQKEQKEDDKQKENNAKKEEKPLDKNNANREVLKLLEEAEKQKRKENTVKHPIQPEKDW